MARQLSFAETEYSKGTKKSRKGVFLGQMDAIVPWKALYAVIEPYYAKIPEKAGRRPYPLESMLRIYLMHSTGLNSPILAWKASFTTVWQCVSLRN